MSRASTLTFHSRRRPVRSTVLRTVLWSGTALALPAAAGEPDRLQPPGPQHAPGLAPRYNPASLLVKFREGTAAEVHDGVVAVLGGEIMRRYRLVPGLTRVELAGMDSAQAAEVLAQLPMVEYAEPDFIARTADTTPNDPSFSKQWGLHNTGQTVNGDPGTNDADIDAPRAWDFYKYAADVTVAVIDGGVQYSSHSDLSANKWSNPGESLNGVDDDHNGFVDDVNGWDFVSNDNVPGDGNGHGTHVAGIIGARGYNGVGICGVAWRVKLMPVRVCDSSGSCATSDCIDGIEYAVENGAHVSNCSWGTYSYSSGLYDCINAAKAAGHLVVAAAGNDGVPIHVTPYYPASFSLGNVISVGASDNDDHLAVFADCGAIMSNFGDAVDLFAPGKNIYSTTISNTYTDVCGTSMAAPHVAGAAALLMSQNPGWSYSRVRERILEMVRPVSALSELCDTGGALDLDRLIVSATPETPTNPHAAYFSGAVTFWWDDRSDWEDGFQVERQTRSGGSWINTAYYTTSENDSDVRQSLVSGTYRYRVRAKNAAGYSAWTARVSVTVP